MQPEGYYGLYSDATRSLLWPAQWCNQKFIMACTVMQPEVHYGLHSDACRSLFWPLQWHSQKLILACTYTCRSLFWPIQWCMMKFISACTVTRVEIYFYQHSEEVYFGLNSCDLFWLMFRGLFWLMFRGLFWLKFPKFILTKMTFSGAAVGCSVGVFLTLTVFRL